MSYPPFSISPGINPGRTQVVVVSAYPLDTDPIQIGKSINLAKKLAARATVVVNSATDGVLGSRLWRTNWARAITAGCYAICPTPRAAIP